MNEDHPSYPPWVNQPRDWDAGQIRCETCGRNCRDGSPKHFSRYGHLPSVGTQTVPQGVSRRSVWRAK